MPSSLTTTLLAGGFVAAAVQDSTAALLLVGLAIGLELVLFIAAGFKADDGLGA